MSIGIFCAYNCVEMIKGIIKNILFICRLIYSYLFVLNYKIKVILTFACHCEKTKYVVLPNSVKRFYTIKTWVAKSAFNVLNMKTGIPFWKRPFRLLKKKAGRLLVCAKLQKLLNIPLP